MDAISNLAELLRGAQRAVAFTGAGISTESGVPDFRSPGGVWTKHRPVMFDEFLRSREARARYWKFRMEAYRDFAAAAPNVGHMALARLEESNRIRAVITQNIDGLHQIAGSRRVIELHGTARIVGCLGCLQEWSPEEIHARVERGDDAPDCEDCGAPLKAKTISFGQAMPVEAMRECEQLAEECDLFLAIGSSLVVEPAASLPRRAAMCGAPLVIINRDETPLDNLASIVIRASIGEVMTNVMSRM